MNRISSQRLYFDYAAASPMRTEVVRKILPYFSEAFVNPSSIYEFGQKVRRDIDTARYVIAESVGSLPNEIIFTSSGTEANNLAIMGHIRSIQKTKSQKSSDNKQKIILTTKIEHSSILEPCRKMAENGDDIRIDYIPLFPDGGIDLHALKKMITPEVILISIAHGNNEIGTLQPIEEIGIYVKKYRETHHAVFPLLHIDACQSFGFYHFPVKAIGIDSMSWSGGKIYGPKGSGVLYKREDIDIEPLIYGGGQEGGLRSGTENVSAIIGLGEAVRLITKERRAYKEHCRKMTECFMDGIRKKITRWSLIGPNRQEKRLPNNIYIIFDDIESEMLLVLLDAMGMCISAGAACKGGSSQPSHVLMGIGVSVERAYRGVRISVGKGTTSKEVEQGVYALSEAVNQLRTRG